MHNPAPTEALACPTPRIAHVVVVEDDLSFLDSVMEGLAQAEEFELVAVAHTRKDGLALLQRPAPDVMLVDLGLPDGSGIDVIRAAAEHWPRCNVVVSTLFGDEVHVIRAIEAGAKGYLLKGGAPASLVDNMRILMQGGSPISPVIARQVLLRFKTRTRQSSPDSIQNLAESELTVLDLITKGFTAIEIAELQGISRATVLTYTRRIYAKLGVNSKAEAIFEAKVRNLVIKEKRSGA